MVRYLSSATLSAILLLVAQSLLYAQNIWQSANNGLSLLSVTALTASGDGTLFAAIASRNGSDYVSEIARSTNNGASWVVVSDRMPDIVTELMATGAESLLAGVAGDYRSFIRKGSILRSTDNGHSWLPVHDTIIGMAMAFAGGARGEILAGTGENTSIGTDRGALYRSIDDGVTWSPLNFSKPVNSIAVNSAGDIFVGAYWSTDVEPFGGGSIHRSTDGGQSWARVLDSVDNPVLAITKSGIILAGSGNKVWCSVNKGDTWSFSRPGSQEYKIQGIKALVIDSSGAMFTGGNGIYRSTDGGQTWEEWDSGMFARSMHALLITGGYIFAGSSIDGVYRSVMSVH